MTRILIIGSILVATGWMIKSHYATETKTKSVKLSGLSVPKPKQKSLAPTSPIVARRSVAQAPQAKPLVDSSEKKMPIEALSPEQKIERAKQAWENIRVKALDRLRIDQRTRDEIEDLRSEFKTSQDPDRYHDYLRKMQDLLGEENYAFLNDVREEFKSRVFERAQIEIGPHLGEL